LVLVFADCKRTSIDGMNGVPAAGFLLAILFDGRKAVFRLDLRTRQTVGSCCEKVFYPGVLERTMSGAG
jgi:hypothetical protein